MRQTPVTSRLAEPLTLQEKKLYHQIHPTKLATDIGVTPIAVWFLWRHEVWPAAVVAFVPPLLVSLALMRWPPARLQRIAASPSGAYLRRFMTPAAEATRFVALAPVAYGAWRHAFWAILAGIVVVAMAWANGLLFPRGHGGRW